MHCSTSQLVKYLIPIAYIAYDDEVVGDIRYSCNEGHVAACRRIADLLHEIYKLACIDTDTFIDYFMAYMSNDDHQRRYMSFGDKLMDDVASRVLKDDYRRRYNSLIERHKAKAARIISLIDIDTEYTEYEDTDDTGYMKNSLLSLEILYDERGFRIKIRDGWLLDMCDALSEDTTLNIRIIDIQQVEWSNKKYVLTAFYYNCEYDVYENQVFPAETARFTLGVGISDKMYEEVHLDCELFGKMLKKKAIDGMVYTLIVPPT